MSMRTAHVTRAIVAIVSLSAAAPSWSQTREEIDRQDRQRTAGAEAEFADIERIARLPVLEQAKHVEWLYREVAPVVVNRRYALAWVPRREALFLDANTLTPEVLADRIGEKLGYPYLHEASRIRCLDVLRAHQDLLTPVVRADLGSRDAARILRALGVVEHLRWTHLVDGIIPVLQQAARRELAESTPPAWIVRPDTLGSDQHTNAEVTRTAAWVLQTLDDPRGIRALLEADATAPLAHYGVLAHLGRERAAEPALVAFLRSPDPEVRYRAAYALSGSGDQALVPAVHRLSADPDARVRREAARMGSSIGEPGAAAVRPQLLALLRDSDVMVRYDTALRLGSRRDVVSAPAIHELIASGALQDGYISGLVDTMHSLTGTYFGYDKSQTPRAEVNRAAMQRFAAWIDERVKR